MKESIVREAVVPWGTTLFFGLAAAFLIALQFGLDEAIASEMVEEENVICTVQAANAGEEGGFLGFGATDPNLRILCGDREYSETDTRVIVSYLKNPRPLVCTTYRDGETASCELQGP